MNERFLVTGAMGCIGAWTVRELALRGRPVSAADISTDRRRLAAITDPDALATVEFTSLDITSLESTERVVADKGVTNIIHLAALQIPFAKADPPLGARVNVVGTVNVFEAARRHADHVGSVVYMSSIGMYDTADADVDTSHLSEDAVAHPRTHYGVYKLANEGNASVYWLDAGLPSVGLRPYIVYGPGRDQGVTSGPTLAMKAAAEGQPFHIGFGGRAVYQYTGDIGRQIVETSVRVGDGARVFNLGGSTIEMREIVDAITSVIPEAEVTFDDKPLPFPSQVDHKGIDAFLGSEARLTDFL